MSPTQNKFIFFIYVSVNDVVSGHDHQKGKPQSHFKWPPCGNNASAGDSVVMQL